MPKKRENNSHDTKSRTSDVDRTDSLDSEKKRYWSVLTSSKRLEGSEDQVAQQRMEQAQIEAGQDHQRIIQGMAKSYKDQLASKDAASKPKEEKTDKSKEEKGSKTKEEKSEKPKEEKVDQSKEENEKPKEDTPKEKPERFDKKALEQTKRIVQVETQKLLVNSEHFLKAEECTQRGDFKGAQAHLDRLRGDLQHESLRTEAHASLNVQDGTFTFGKQTFALQDISNIDKGCISINQEKGPTEIRFLEKQEFSVQDPRVDFETGMIHLSNGTAVPLKELHLRTPGKKDLAPGSEKEKNAEGDILQLKDGTTLNLKELNEPLSNQVKDNQQELKAAITVFNENSLAYLRETLNSGNPKRVRSAFTQIRLHTAQTQKMRTALENVRVDASETPFQVKERLEKIAQGKLYTEEQARFTQAARSYLQVQKDQARALNKPAARKLARKHLAGAHYGRSGNTQGLAPTGIRVKHAEHAPHNIPSTRLESTRPPSSDYAPLPPRESIHTTTKLASTLRIGQPLSPSQETHAATSSLIRLNDEVKPTRSASSPRPKDRPSEAKKFQDSIDEKFKNIDAWDEERQKNAAKQVAALINEEFKDLDAEMQMEKEKQQKSTASHLKRAARPKTTQSRASHVGGQSKQSTHLYRESIAHQNSFIHTKSNRSSVQTRLAARSKELELRRKEQENRIKQINQNEVKVLQAKEKLQKKQEERQRLKPVRTSEHPSKAPERHIDIQENPPFIPGKAQPQFRRPPKRRPSIPQKFLRPDSLEGTGGTKRIPRNRPLSITENHSENTLRSAHVDQRAKTPGLSPTLRIEKDSGEAAITEMRTRGDRKEETHEITQKELEKIHPILQNTYHIEKLVRNADKDRPGKDYSDKIKHHLKALKTIPIPRGLSPEEHGFYEYQEARVTHLRAAEQRWQETGDINEMKAAIYEVDLYDQIMAHNQQLQKDALQPGCSKKARKQYLAQIIKDPQSFMQHSNDGVKDLADPKKPLPTIGGKTPEERTASILLHARAVATRRFEEEFTKEDNVEKREKMHTTRDDLIKKYEDDFLKQYANDAKRQDDFDKITHLENFIKQSIKWQIIAQFLNFGGPNSISKDIGDASSGIMKALMGVAKF